MVKRVQRLAQGAATPSTFIGLEAEFIVDTNTWSIRVHDGVTPGGHLVLNAGLNLSDLSNASQARSHLNLGSVALLDTDEVLLAENNLSDLDDAGMARENLGLSDVALSSKGDTLTITAGVLDVLYGTAANTAAQGNDTRIVGALQSASNLSDVASATTTRTNIGLGALATLSSVNNANWSGTALSIANGGSGATSASAARTAFGLGALAVLSSINDANWSGTPLSVANGGSGATTASAARTAFGLGSAATKSTGTAGTTVPLLDGLNTWSATQNFADVTMATPLAVADGGTGGTTQGTARSGIGLGSLATLSTISDANWSGTDLAIVNGGTGSSTASGARSNLGLGSLATLSSINNGNWSGTDLSVANGGTGASTAADAKDNLGIVDAIRGSALWNYNGSVVSKIRSNGSAIGVLGRVSTGKYQANATGSVAIIAFGIMADNTNDPPILGMCVNGVGTNKTFYFRDTGNNLVDPTYMVFLDI